MTDERLHPVLTQLCRRAGADPLGACSDRCLVERFVTDRDEAAFEALVRRHGPMVLGVCRRLLSEPADAEDAFQATFLVFVRKARGLSDPGRVGAWLHGVACRTAREARTRRAWRDRRERQLDPMPEPPTAAPADDWKPLIDEEVGRLPEKYRAAVVLCELEGQSRGEAARHLGVPEGTLSSRLARARDLLRSRLSRRGVALALGTAALCETVPPPLVALTTHTSPGAPGETAAAALADRVLKAMAVSRLGKATVVVLVALGLAGAGTVLLARRPAPAVPAALVQDLPAAPAPPPPAEAPKPQPRLSARLVVAAEVAADAPEFKGALVLTNDGAVDLKVCTLCAGNDGLGGPFARHFRPDWWKSDAPPLEASAGRVVTLTPGRSVGLPFTIPASAYRTRDSFTITAYYAVEQKAFVEKLGLWAGKVTAEPATVAVRTSPGRDAIATLEKLGANCWSEENDPTKIVEVNASSDRVTDADLIHLRAFPSLRRLRVGSKATDAGLEHVRDLVHLEELIADVSGITDVGLGCLGRLTKLRVLNLNYTAVTDVGLRRLEGLRGLEELRLHKTAITDAGLASLGKLKELRFLDVGGGKVTGKGLRSLAGLDRLETLYLHGSALTDESLAALRQFPALRALSLAATAVSDAGLARLPPLPRVRNLYLAHTRVTGAGLRLLVRMPALEELDLSGTPVADAGLAVLGQIRTLRTLKLSGTKVSDAGLGQLARLGTLEELHLNGTAIGDAGLAQLRRLTGLRRLYIADTKVTDRGVAALRQALPAVQVARMTFGPSGLESRP